MTEVKFYRPSFDPDAELVYSVIVARYESKWIFVRHRKRNTWEIPGGHIEKNESSSDAARRELMEETGALKFDLVCVATYSVKKDGFTGYGRLYFAEVYELAEIPEISEVAEIELLNQLPGDLTYPDIQPSLFRETVEYLERVGRI
ncbi:MAG: NUDIX domain-containing protein [Bacteroidales bacterium]|nr:NUDIX domain-containing protein [Bacteroidales bacterium]